MSARRLTVLVSLALFTASGRAAQLQTTPLAASSEPVSREISGTEKHEYRVTLKAQQALHIVVNKFRVNVVMNVSGPDGEPVVEMASLTGPTGSESVWAIASKTGDYTLGIRLRNARGSGRYELRVDALRDATADDRKHLELQDALVAAFQSDNVRAAGESLRRVLTAARTLKEEAVTAMATAALLHLDPRTVLETSGLNSIPGVPQAYYSSGYEQRTRSMRDRLKPAIEFFESKLQVKVAVHLLLLARDDWARLVGTSRAYGVPWADLAPAPTSPSPRDGLVCIAATLEQEFKQASAGMQRPGALAPDVVASLKATGLSFEDGLQLASDERMYHELGHVYAYAYGIEPRADAKWLNEFLATFLWVAYDAEVARPGDPGRSFMTAWMDYHRDSYKPTAVTLDTIGGEPGRYSWFQIQFKERAEDVYKAQGLAFLRRVRDVLPPTSERMSVEESLARLEKISPGFVKWAADLAAQGPSEGVR